MQRMGAAIGTVAADYHKPLDACLFKLARGPGAAFGRHEHGTARRPQHGAAMMDNAAYGARGQRFNLAVNQALIPATNAKNLHIRRNGGANNGAYGGVHAGRVASAGENRDFFH
jgi:hypothetical protein